MLANRAFLGRAVRYLAAQAGIRQFLDIGSGIPTMGNVHEIAQQAAPGARIVYVDNDPVAVLHSRAILARNARATAIQADLRQPRQILEHPGLPGPTTARGIPSRSQPTAAPGTNDEPRPRRTPRRRSLARRGQRGDAVAHARSTQLPRPVRPADHSEAAARTPGPAEEP